MRVGVPTKPAISRQRARSPQDKDLRRAHLIEAATRLFADADFDAVTIARVAEGRRVWPRARPISTLPPKRRCL